MVSYRIALLIAIASTLSFSYFSVAAQHPTYPDFAQPISSFLISKDTITFPTEQSADSITLTITDDAIYRYVQTSFDGQNWIQRTIQNSTQCSFHPDDPAHDWLTGTCTLSIPMSPADFPSLAPSTTITRNYITAYSCTEVTLFTFRIGWNCHGSPTIPQMWQIRQFDATLEEESVETIELECEDGTLFGDMQFNSSVISDPPCGQGWIETASGTPNFLWDSGNPSMSDHRAELPVMLSDGGTYYACIRMASPSGSQDTLYAGFSSDDMRRFYPDSSIYPYDQSWTWVSEIPTDPQRLVFENMASGDYTFIIGHGEAGARCDKVVLTTDPSLNCNTYISCESTAACQDDDSICPEGCTPANDNDCDEEPPPGPPLAFPGAEGFANHVRGAYGDPAQPPRILIVDTLDTGNTGDEATGRGTFRWALARSYPRIILFEVGGFIDYAGVTSTIRISNPYVTIYGQSAPGQGVNIVGTLVEIRTHDVIIQHMKFRYGDDVDGSDPNARDSFELGPGARDVFIDHCSFSWAMDEIVGFSSSEPLGKVTFSNNILAEGLDRSFHYGGAQSTPEAHSLAMLAGGTGDSSLTLKGNLLAFTTGRTPALALANSTIINNFVYGGNGAGSLRSASRLTSVVGNLVVPLDHPRLFPTTMQYSFYVHDSMPSDSRLYVSENECYYGNNNPSATQWDMVDHNDRVTQATASPFDLSEYSILPVSQVEDYVLSNAGAFYWNRDYADERAVENTRNMVPVLIDSPFSTPAFASKMDQKYINNAGMMSSGHDWQASPETIVVNGVTINLNQDCDNIQEVIDHINSQVPSGVEAYRLNAYIDLNWVGIRTTGVGSSQTLTLSGGGLDTLGIPAGTYYGSNGQGYDFPSSSRSLTSIPGYPSADPHGDDDSDGYTNIEEWAYGLGHP